jgi:hypothetical protein
MSTLNSKINKQQERKCMKELTSIGKGLNKTMHQTLFAWHPRRRAKTTNSEKTTNKIS